MDGQGRTLGGMTLHRQVMRLASGLWLCLLVCVVGLGGPGRAADDHGGKRSPALEWTGESADSYAACIESALHDPDDGFENAIAWRDSGGGAPAKHCVAVALFAQGYFAEAAVRLETLEAEERTLAPSLRTGLLGQAGLAWHAAGELVRAEAVLARALALNLNDIDILIERSLVRADKTFYISAIEDLDRVLKLKPDHADALTFRAAAHRKLREFDLAAKDIERALKGTPDHLPALLERGLLRLHAGDERGARADWLRVLALAPDSPAADAARYNLEQLDVRTE